MENMEKLIEYLESGDFGNTGHSAAQMLRSIAETRDQYRVLCKQKEADLAERQIALRNAIRQLDMLRWITETAKPGDKIYVVSSTRVEEATISSITYDEENKLMVSLSFKCDHCCSDCPFEAPWEDHVSGESGCDGEYGGMEIPISKLGVTFFNDRALADKVLKEFWE